ncbi:hypothetical protein BH23VER1_BH23VER1_00990 [soil metagenome]
MPNKVALELVQSVAPVAAPLVMLIDLWELSEFLAESAELRSSPHILLALMESDRSPPAALLVAQCTVMLV